MSLARRQWLTCSAVGLGAAVLGQYTAAAAPAMGKPMFRYCLNTGTIRGQKVPLADEVEIAAKAGYQAIEPWIEEIQKHKESGKSTADLRKRIADRGLTVESAIGFANWIDDDPQRRAAGLEQFRRDMDLLAQIGGRRIAAPPAGATKTAITDLLAIAERLAVVADLAKQFGLVPELELWGGSKTLSRIGEVAYVLAECNRPETCALLDLFHIYRSGTPLSGVRLFSGQRMAVFHVNDYPAAPTPDKLTDADRIYPGDGVAPYTSLLRDLRDIGFNGFLSLELFNREYWKQDPLEVARTGLAKIQAVVNKAFS